MAPRSLKDLCFSLLIHHLDGLVDIGDMDYMLLRPVLMNIDDPQQLREIEENSSQVIGYSGEIWRKMINKHFESKLIESQGDLTPENPEDWYQVYERLEALKQEEEQAAEEFLRRRMADHNQAKDANMIKAPTQFLKPKSSSTSHWSSSYGSAPKPRTAMGQIRRATANVAARRRIGAVNTPKASTSAFRRAPPPVRSSIVRAAPQHMIDAARKTEAEKARIVDSAVASNRRRIPLFRAPPGASSASAPPGDPFSKASIAQREARLNGLKMGTNAAADAPPAAASPQAASRPQSTPRVSVASTPLLSASAAARQQQSVRKVMTTTGRPRESAAQDTQRPPPARSAVHPPRTTPAKRPIDDVAAPGRTTNTPAKRKKGANDSFLKSASRPSIGRSQR